MLSSRLADDLRRAAVGQGLPSEPAAVRARVEQLMTDAAAIAFTLERRCLAVKDEHRDALLRAATDPHQAADALARYEVEHDLQAEIDELRALTGALRRRFTVDPDA